MLNAKIVLLLLLSLLGPISAFAHFVYTQPPENYHPRVEVAACFIIADDKVLFLHRLSHTSDGNLWGIPGGKLEKNESAEQAVIREIQEETGLDLQTSTIKNLGTVYIRVPEVDFTYHMFSVQLDEIPPVHLSATEHSDYRWITLKEALELPLIRGEDECIHLIYGEDL